jgi:glycosyltransferase involved in cell wall biosynthesis
VAEQPEASLVSIVVPIYNEADNILPLLEAIKAGVSLPHETLLVYDFDEDTTIPPARGFARGYPELRLVENDIGPGALNAIKSGFAQARGDAIVVTMADLSDDVSQIDDMTSRVRAGAGVVAGSRYMAGGRQIGGPALKGFLSRMAGLSLFWLTGIGTHDATNNFKAYAHDFIGEVVVESSRGFELGLELATKAYLAGFDIEEIPTTWRDRTAGESRFRTFAWMPGYLRWYFACITGAWTGRARRARAKRRSAPRSSPPRSADVSKG